MAKYSEIVINIGVEKEASIIGVAPMSSTTATLVMGDALAAVLIRMKDFKESDFAKYHPGGSLGKRLLLTVKDIMHSGDELPVVTKDENIENVLMILTKKKMGAVCITDTGKENGKLKGIITEGDIRRALAHKDEFFGYKARDIMIQNPISIDVEAMALNALNLMEKRESQISVLPVVENEKLVEFLKSTTALEHRLENFFVKGNTTFINDSKGTNVESTLKAIDSFNNAIIMILGGDDKKIDNMPLIKRVKEKVDFVYLIGDNAQILIDDMEKVGYKNYKKFRDS